MANLKQIQDQIYGCEGFTVVINDSEGRARPRLRDYEFERAARAAFTVGDWRGKRFAALYPGFKVDVLRANGQVATARMTLERVRREYEG